MKCNNLIDCIRLVDFILDKRSGETNELSFNFEVNPEIVDETGLLTSSITDSGSIKFSCTEHAILFAEIFNYYF